MCAPAGRASNAACHVWPAGQTGSAAAGSAALCHYASTHRGHHGELWGECVWCRLFSKFAANFSKLVNPGKASHVALDGVGLIPL